MILPKELNGILDVWEDELDFCEWKFSNNKKNR